MNTTVKYVRLHKGAILLPTFILHSGTLLLPMLDYIEEHFC